MSAAEKVLNTVELLEAILIELPMRDLLLSQRVSKTFKATIDGSSKIQKALFFAPATEELAYCGSEMQTYHSPHSSWDQTHHAHCSCNLCQPRQISVDYYYLAPESTATALLSPTPESPESAAARWKGVPEPKRCRLLLNPLLKRHFDPFGTWFNSHHDPWDGNEAPAVALRSPEASWRRMLLTQPPLGAVSLEYRRRPEPVPGFALPKVFVRDPTQAGLLVRGTYFEGLGEGPMRMGGLCEAKKRWMMRFVDVNGVEGLRICCRGFADIEVVVAAIGEEEREEGRRQSASEKGHVDGVSVDRLGD